LPDVQLLVHALHIVLLTGLGEVGLLEGVGVVVSMVEQINSEPEFVFDKAVHILAQQHVGVNQTYGHNKVEAKFIYHVD
jgi:type III secretory pathway component EscS